MSNNLTVGRRLAMGFGAILVILVALSAYSTVIYRDIVNDLKTIKKGKQEVELLQYLKLSVVQVQQFLTDSSATGNEEVLGEAEEWSNRFKKTLKELEEGGADLAALDSLERTFDKYYQTGLNMAKVYIAQGREAGNIIMEDFDVTALEMAASVESLSEKAHHKFDGQLMKTTGSATDANVVNIVASLVALLFGVAAAVWITRGVNRELGWISEKLSAGADQVASASEQLSSSSQSLAQGAAEQASSLEETSSSLEEMSSTVKQNADNATQANQLSRVAKETAEKGAESVNKMITAVDEINKSSEEVSRIIKVIDQIAFQTNLLALNAAVEAARAGEHGKGFAVVAEEVRNLAGRSAEAAKDTARLIEESTVKAREGTKLANESGEVLKEIVTNTNKATNLIGEIAAASREQSEGISQVTNAVTQMDQVTQQNSALSEETSSASQELSAQSENLRSTVKSLTLIVGAQAVGNIGSKQFVSHPAREQRLKGHPVYPMTKNLRMRDKPADNGDGHVKLVHPDEVIPMNEEEFKEF